MVARKHIYGAVTLLKSWCVDCSEDSIVIDGRLQCCDELVQENEKFGGYKRESIATFKRKLPNKKLQDGVLKAQQNKCFYCERGLEEWISTFVAACCQCNQWKKSKIFQTVEEARSYLIEKLREYQQKLS